LLERIEKTLDQLFTMTRKLKIKEIKKLEEEYELRKKGLDLILLNDKMFLEKVGRRRLDDTKNDILDHLIRIKKRIQVLKNDLNIK
jgi:hypothetical protein